MPPSRPGNVRQPLRHSRVTSFQSLFLKLQAADAGGEPSRRGDAGAAAAGRRAASQQGDHGARRAREAARNRKLPHQV